MVVYEIEIDDINKFEATFNKIAKEIEAAGHIIDIIVPEKAYPLTLPIYEQVTVFKKSPKK
jgi:hypothetical protein